MRSPGNVKIKIVQFWKLQKKKKSTKPVTKIKAIKIHRYLKIPKIEKSLVVEKKKPTVQREVQIYPGISTSS